mmetsp:Transcript_8013/g.14592  ORF Transcript_8013/g.14592 Transcript_8013/m.14592 type:complete len:272 (+) Transcript_8013:664-1479(+)
MAIAKFYCITGKRLVDRLGYRSEVILLEFLRSERSHLHREYVLHKGNVSGRDPPVPANGRASHPIPERYEVLHDANQSLRGNRVPFPFACERLGLQPDQDSGLVPPSLAGVRVKPKGQVAQAVDSRLPVFARQLPAQLFRPQPRLLPRVQLSLPWQSFRRRLRGQKVTVFDGAPFLFCFGPFDFFHVQLVLHRRILLLSLLLCECVESLGRVLFLSEVQRVSFHGSQRGVDGGSVHPYLVLPRGEFLLHRLVFVLRRRSFFPLLVAGFGRP